MAERSIATDCKSVAPVATKVRILASPPFDAISSRLRRNEILLMAGQSRSNVLSEQRLSIAKSMRVEGQDGRRFYERLGEVVKAGGGSNSVVESQPSKLLVAGSIPVSRSTIR